MVPNQAALGLLLLLLLLLLLSIATVQFVSGKGQSWSHHMKPAAQCCEENDVLTVTVVLGLQSWSLIVLLQVLIVRVPHH